jgi:hypothetical protein
MFQSYKTNIGWEGSISSKGNFTNYTYKTKKLNIWNIYLLSVIIHDMVTMIAVTALALVTLFHRMLCGALNEVHTPGDGLVRLKHVGVLTTPIQHKQ